MEGLPYFKFTPTKWLTGDIVYEPMDVQGLFVNICAVYWERGGELSIEDINKRYKNPPQLSQLTDRFFSVSDGLISINFLDAQIIERQAKTKANRANGMLGGRPKTKKKKPKQNPKEPKDNPTERQKEEEKEKELKRRSLEFKETIRPFVENYGQKMCTNFYNYWSEANHKKGKLKFELQDTWEVSKRLATWANKQEDFKPKEVNHNGLQGII